MFKFYLNGTEIQDQPDGWDNISSSIKRDDLTGGLLFDADIKLNSYGGQDLFISLKTLWDSDRFGTSSFDIYQRSGAAGYVLIHAGTIFHSDLKWKLINNSVEFKVDDASWFAKIKNNRKIDVSLGITQSKNGVVIPAATSFQLQVHKVSNGTYYAQTRKAFKVYDALKFLISYISDNTIGFESSCFNTGGIFEKYCILSGAELIYHTGNDYPRISFDNLFDDLKKRFNIRFVMIGSGSNPIIKIEPNAYFYNNQDALILATPPDEVLLTINTSRLYAGVKVGSEKFETTATLLYPDILPLTTFREETLYFKGEGNVESIMDLVGSLVISSSSIDVCIEQLSGYDGYVDDTVMIYYDPATNKSILWNIAGHHSYNEPLCNINILQRFADDFPSNLAANYVGLNTDGFNAINTNNSTYIQNAYPINMVSTTFGPVQFDDDYTLGNDPGTNYGGATTQGNIVTQLNSYYTAPTNASYVFTANVGIDLLGLVTPSSPSPIINNPGSVICQLQFRHLSGGTIINTVNSGFLVMSLPAQYSINGSTTFLMNAGETVEIHLIFSGNQIPDPIDLQFVYSIIPFVTNFTCSGIDIGVSTVVATNPEAYKALQVSFKYPLTLSEYQQIRASKSGIIEVPLLNNKSIRGWVENVKFDHYGGETSFSLITDGNTIYR